MPWQPRRGPDHRTKLTVHQGGRWAPRVVRTLAILALLLCVVLLGLLAEVAAGDSEGRLR